MTDIVNLQRQMADMMKMMNVLMAKNNQDSLSTTSDSDEKKTYDPDILIKNMFTRLYPKSGDNVMVIDLLKVLYSMKPDMFKPYGDIHTNSEGTKTYQSLKIQVTPTFAYNVHINGAIRWSKFQVSSMDIFYKGVTYTYYYV